MVPQYREGIANTVSQKDEKLHTAWLDDTAKPHIKKKYRKKIVWEKKNSIPQLFNTVRPHAPSRKNRQIKQNKVVISCLSILVWKWRK